MIFFQAGGASDELAVAAGNPKMVSPRRMAMTAKMAYGTYTRSSFFVALPDPKTSPSIADMEVRVETPAMSTVVPAQLWWARML